jgi:hypothetical protein
MRALSGSGRGARERSSSPLQGIIPIATHQNANKSLLSAAGEGDALSFRFARWEEKFLSLIIADLCVNLMI